MGLSPVLRHAKIDLRTKPLLQSIGDCRNRVLAVPGFRLRYGSTDLELPLGRFVVGRSSQCHLALDDLLVSRQHIVFHTTQTEVTLEDLGSRNGVFLNDKAFTGRKVLRHLDRIRLGTQELLLLHRTDNSATTLQFQRCWKCGTPTELERVRCGACNAQLGAKSSITEAGRRAAYDPLADTGEDETTHVGSSFDVLRALAGKSIALGRFTDAERMLGPSLERILVVAKRGMLPHSTRDEAIEVALQLAHGPGTEKWVSWIFKLHTILGRVLSTDLIKSLHTAVRRVRFRGAADIETYLTALSSEDLSPGERFRITQIEGLLRVVRA